MKDKVIICDIDGCVLDTSWIQNEIMLIKSEEEKFSYFNKHVGDNPPKAITKMCDLLRTLNQEAQIFFVTARTESLRTLTWKQLLKNAGILPAAIYMRPEENKEPPHILKEIILNGIITGFDVILAIDDDPKICLMYEKHGIPVICCNSQELMKAEKQKEIIPA